MNIRKRSYGYYHIQITQLDGRDILKSNNERAYILSQLQDMLNPHFVFTDVPLRLQLAPTIDLLSFHIGVKGIDLLIFAVDKTSAYYFALTLLRRLEAYQYDYCLRHSPADIDTSIHIDFIEGVHNALVQSLCIHRLSSFWESDRYSSIGFYLYDRRGDWMRIWRLSQLYDNKSEEYFKMLRDRQEVAAKQPIKIPKSARRHVPSLRE